MAAIKMFGHSHAERDISNFPLLPQIAVLVSGEEGGDVFGPQQYLAGLDAVLGPTMPRASMISTKRAARV